MRARARLPVLVAAVTLCVARPGAAFEVGSLITDPCHERITIAGYLLTTLDIPRDRVVVPPPGPWMEVAGALAAKFKVTIADDVELFFFHSLILGARVNDTDGHSTLDLSALRQIHLYPEGQYEHCLRTADDDGEAGNAAAVAGCRQVVLAHTDESAAAANLPPEAQIATVTFEVDFYGTVEVEAWAPAFALGCALHVLQDSFAHTVRTADLRGVIQVTNYAEALVSDWDERRDGLRHSPAMDVCSGETEPVVAAALQATVDLLIASKASLGTADRLEVTAVADKWLQYVPGCTLDNDYCDSPWAARVRDHPTRPYLAEMFGCRAAPGSPRSAAAGLLLLVGLLAGRRNGVRWM